MKWSIQKTVLLVITVFAFALGFWLLNTTVFSLDTTHFDRWINQFTGWRPLMISGLIAAEVIIVPLSGSWLSLATQYLFGPVVGFISAYAGNIIGVAVLYEVCYYFGRPVLKPLDRYRIVLGWLYAIPLFPIDILTVLLGLVRFSRRRFYTTALIGLLPNMLLSNWLSAYIAQPDYQYVLLSCIVIAIVTTGLLHWLSKAGRTRR